MRCVQIVPLIGKATLHCLRGEAAVHAVHLKVYLYTLQYAVQGIFPHIAELPF